MHNLVMTSNFMFFLMGHSRPLFHLFSSFLQTVNNNCSIKVVDDWIRTQVLWYRKRPRCQLCYNHSPHVIGSRFSKIQQRISCFILPIAQTLTTLVRQKVATFSLSFSNIVPPLVTYDSLSDANR